MNLTDIFQELTYNLFQANQHTPCFCYGEEGHATEICHEHFLQMLPYQQESHVRYLQSRAEVSTSPLDFDPSL